MGKKIIISKLIFQRGSFALIDRRKKWKIKAAIYPSTFYAEYLPLDICPHIIQKKSNQLTLEYDEISFISLKSLNYKKKKK